MAQPSADPRVRDLGAQVRSVRERIGMSQSEAARRAGVSRTSLHSLEAGTGGSPNYTTLLGVADALGVHVHSLIPKS